MPTALLYFCTAQELAKQQNKRELEGEVFKWTGHSYGKLSDMKNAEVAFTAGIEFATTHKLPKLEIDCLSGLGVLYRWVHC